jgi:hypothetical protein
MNMRDNLTLHLDTNKGNGTSILFLFFISVWRCVQLDWNLSEVDETLWFGLVWFMVFNATFDNISIIICGGQCSLRKKPEYREKTTDLLQVTRGKVN